MKPLKDNIFGLVVFSGVFIGCLVAGFCGARHQFYLSVFPFAMMLVIFFDGHYAPSIYKCLTSKRK